MSLDSGHVPRAEGAPYYGIGLHLHEVGSSRSSLAQILTLELARRTANSRWLPFVWAPEAIRITSTCCKFRVHPAHQAVDH